MMNSVSSDWLGSDWCSYHWSEPFFYSVMTILGVADGTLGIVKPSLSGAARIWTSDQKLNDVATRLGLASIPLA